MDWQKASIELSKKLDPANVKPAKQFGPKGDYLEGWHIMDEANAIFGFGGWSYHVVDKSVVAQAEREVGKQKKPGWGVSYVATVRVIVAEVVREDVGAGHGYDVDLGLAHESAIKEAVTDAVKRAMRGFGNRFGLALYDKSRVNVGAEPTDRDIAIAKEMIGEASTVEIMTERWRALPPHVGQNTAVIEAAKARKEALTQKETA